MTARSLIKQLSERVNDLYAENRDLNERNAILIECNKSIESESDRLRMIILDERDRREKAMNDQGKTIVVMMYMGVVMAVVVGLSIFFALQ